MTTTDSPILVTGGSGFIVGHCILQLLAAQRPVRATVRSRPSADSARALLSETGAQHLDLLEFVIADLTSDRGWPVAVDGVAGVLHVASPVAPGHMGNEEDVIGPAREGALRVLRAAREAGVPRGGFRSRRRRPRVHGR